MKLLRLCETSASLLRKNRLSLPRDVLRQHMSGLGSLPLAGRLAFPAAAPYRIGHCDLLSSVLSLCEWLILILEEIIFIC